MLCCVSVLATLENIGFVANMSTMVLYFHFVLFFDMQTSANTLTNFLGSTFFLTILGGFISDTYMNRLYTCLLFGFLEIMVKWISFSWRKFLILFSWLLSYVGFFSSLFFFWKGLLLVTIQAHAKNLQPDPCNNKPSCIKGSESIFFYSSLCMLALGCGGVKGSIAALGADQFDRKDVKGAKGVASYFNYYQFSATVGSLIGVTVVVWIALHRGWQWAFFTGLVTVVVGFVVLALGKSFYLFPPLSNSPIVRISQVRPKKIALSMLHR